MKLTKESAVDAAINVYKWSAIVITMCLSIAKPFVVRLISKLVDYYCWLRVRCNILAQKGLIRYAPRYDCAIFANGRNITAQFYLLSMMTTITCAYIKTHLSASTLTIFTERLTIHVDLQEKTAKRHDAVTQKTSLDQLLFGEINLSRLLEERRQTD